MSTTLHPDNTTPEHDDTASEDGNSAAGEGSQVWADAADDAQSEPELEPGQEDGDHDHADSSATITDGAQLAEREDKRLTFLAWEQGKGLDSTLQNLSLADELAGTGELGPEPSTPTPAHTQHQPEQPSTPVNEQTEGQLEKNSTSDPAPAPASSAPSMHPADRLESARSSPSSLASSIRAVSAAPAAPVSESEGSTATAPAGTKPAGTKGAGIAALMKRFDGSASGAAPSSPTSPFAHRQGASPRAGAPAKASATTQVGSAVGSAAALAEATGSLRSPSTAEPSESALGKVRGNTAAEMEMSGAKGAELPQQATDEQAKAQANALDEAAAFAVLPDTGKERVPPAVGATSLLDPETQIANPFRASESSGSSTAGTEGEWTGTRSDSRAEGEGDPARFSTATSGLRSSQISLSSSSVWRRSGAPSLDANGTRGAGAAASSNRFSVVSLGSTAPSFAQSAHDGDEGPGVRRRTITTTSASGSPQLGTPGNGPAFASSSDEASKNGMGTGPQEMDPRNYDFLLARLETQNARLSRDPKAQRASVDGADKLRENFERLANRERRKSQRGSGVLGGQAQDAQDERNGLAAREGAATQAEDLYADVDADGDEAIDWDFWGNVMSSEFALLLTEPPLQVLFRLNCSRHLSVRTRTRAHRLSTDCTRPAARTQSSNTGWHSGRVAWNDVATDEQ